MLGSLLGEMCLQLPPILLVLLDEWLILICDVVVIQEWSLVEPVRKVRNGGLHNLEGAVLVDVLAIRTQYLILLHLTVLPKRRLEADVVEWSDFVSIGNIFDIMYGPFGQSCNAV